MAKMEIEFSDEQLERVKELEDNNISVGQAIDMLFEMKEKAMPEIDAIDNDICVFAKIKENTLDVDSKADNLEENYGEADLTYEMKVQDIKHKVSWAKDFFKF